MILAAIRPEERAALGRNFRLLPGREAVVWRVGLGGYTRRSVLAILRSWPELGAWDGLDRALRPSIDGREVVPISTVQATTGVPARHVAQERNSRLLGHRVPLLRRHEDPEACAVGRCANPEGIAEGIVQVSVRPLVAARRKVALGRRLSRGDLRGQERWRSGTKQHCYGEEECMANVGGHGTEDRAGASGPSIRFRHAHAAALGRKRPSGSRLEADPNRLMSPERPHLPAWASLRRRQACSSSGWPALCSTASSTMVRRPSLSVRRSG